MLSADRLTVKASEALQTAAAEARQRGNAEVHGVHLLDALLAQEEGIVIPILQKIEVRVGRVRAQAADAWTCARLSTPRRTSPASSRTSSYRPNTFCWG